MGHGGRGSGMPWERSSGCLQAGASGGGQSAEPGMPCGDRDLGLSGLPGAGREGEVMRSSDAGRIGTRGRAVQPGGSQSGEISRALHVVTHTHTEPESADHDAEAEQHYEKSDEMDRAAVGTSRAQPFGADHGSTIAVTRVSRVRSGKNPGADTTRSAVMVMSASSRCRVRCVAGSRCAAALRT